MKNIWKLLMIALMALAMVGCPQDNKSDDEEDGGSDTVNPGVYTKGTGVYSAEGDRDSIEQPWSGSFTIILVKDSQWKDGTGSLAGLKTINPQMDGTKAEPVYQLKYKDNTQFKKYPKNNGYVAVTDKGDNAYQYKSVAAKINGSENKASVIVDMSKIPEDELFAMVKITANNANKSNEFGGKKWLAGGNNIDLTGYKPYVVGAYATAASVGTFAFKGKIGWEGNANIYALSLDNTASVPDTTSDQYQTEFQPDSDVTKIDATTTAQNGAKFVVCGNSFDGAGFEIPFEDGKAIKEITFDLSEDEDGEPTITTGNAWGMDYYAFWMKFAAGPTATTAPAEAQYYSKKVKLGEAAPLSATKETGFDNYECEDLTEAGTYILTIDATVSPATITMTKKP